MSYINTGSQLLEAIRYSLRREYTGYIDTPKLLTYVNEIALNMVKSIINNSDDKVLMTNFPKLRVSTDTLSVYDRHWLWPIVKISSWADGFIFKVPLFDFSEGYTTLTTLGSIKYPNIARLIGIRSLVGYVYPAAEPTFPTKDDPGDAVTYWSNYKKVIIISQEEYMIVRERYYRQPDTDLIYAYIVTQSLEAGNVFSWLYLSNGTNQHIVLDYYKFPDPIINNDDSTDYTEEQMENVKNAVTVQFLERIKDERFKNFISNSNNPKK
jgi:hypothetical protein